MPEGRKVNKLSKEDLKAVADAVADTLDERFEKLQMSIDKCAQKEDVEQIKANVRTNRYEYDRLEQYTRRENVRIHKWTVDDSSPLTPQVIELLNQLAELGTKDGEDLIQFRESDISTCHGVGVGAKTQTLVRFVSREKVRDVFKMKKNLKDSVKFKGTFITEDMTALRMKRLQVVNDDKETSDVYTINRNIHVTYRKKNI